jgi:opacity protein-like surface antigen
MTRLAASWLVVCALAAPLEAQVTPPSTVGPDRVSILGVGFLARQWFTADTTFDAVFGDHTGLFFGGGIQLAQRGVYLEVTLARFERSGQRVFVDDGEVFPLDIPLTATIVPFELSGGYQFRRRSAIVPYAGGGIGSYRYTETSDFADASDEVDVRHVGYLVLGGAEFRVHRLIGVAADVQYTHIGGILGSDGLSGEAGEDNLGGTAVRARVIVGVRR